MKLLRLKPLLAGISAISLCIVIVVTGPESLEASLPSGQPQVTTAIIERSMITSAVSAYGTLTPRQALKLTSQVPGEITWVSPDLFAGGRIKAGQALFRIDQRDYAIALASAEAKYAQSEANIDLERGRSENAELEWSKWQRIQGDEKQATSLALREPQQAEALAVRAFNLAELDKAKLALQRTVVSSPWPASVIHSTAISGQLVSVGDSTATLYPVDYAIVELQVSLKTLRLLDSGIQKVELRPIDMPDSVPVEAEFEGIVRNLTNDTRLATVRVRVKRPLDNNAWAYGMHLAANIITSAHQMATKVPASVIVSGNLIWVYRDGRAIRHQVKPIEHKGDLVVVEDNFSQGDSLIIERPIGLFDGAEVAAVGI